MTSGIFGNGMEVIVASLKQRCCVVSLWARQLILSNSPQGVARLHSLSLIYSSRLIASFSGNLSKRQSRAGFMQDLLAGIGLHRAVGQQGAQNKSGPFFIQKLGSI